VGIRRVADEASVSIATVSRVVSGRGPVNEDTRVRVQRVVERLGYLPSASARSLRTSRTMIVGVLVPDLSNPVFVPFLRGVQQVAQAEGYSVLVVDAQRSASIERRALDRLAEQRVDALVLAGTARDPERIDELVRAGMAVVDGRDRARPSRSRIADLESPGTVAMCEALATLGHRRIGFVSRGGSLGDAGRRRWELVRRTSRRLGVRAERIRVDAGASPDGVAGVLRGAIRRDDPVTALVCSTHGLAPTLLGGMGAARILVPDTCSFVTYGDSEWALAYRPAIGVVTMDLFSLASVMTRRLIAALRGEPESDPDVEPEPARFIARDSVRAAPA
jgi:LacI family transcriptional regulator